MSSTRIYETSNLLNLPFAIKESNTSLSNAVQSSQSYSEAIGEGHLYHGGLVTRFCFTLTAAK